MELGTTWDQDEKDTDGWRCFREGQFNILPGQKALYELFASAIVGTATQQIANRVLTSLVWDWVMGLWQRICILTTRNCT